MQQLLPTLCPWIKNCSLEKDCTVRAYVLTCILLLKLYCPCLTSFWRCLYSIPCHTMGVGSSKQHICFFFFFPPTPFFFSRFVETNGRVSDRLRVISKCCTMHWFVATHFLSQKRGKVIFYLMLPEFRKGTALRKVLTLRSFVLLVTVTCKYERNHHA